MPPLTVSEAEVTLNRTNVALSRSQRLVASWLPPRPTNETVAKAEADKELQEEDEIFTAVPER